MILKYLRSATEWVFLKSNQFSIWLNLVSDILFCKIVLLSTNFYKFRKQMIRFAHSHILYKETHNEKINTSKDLDSRIDCEASN